MALNSLVKLSRIGICSVESLKMLMTEETPLTWATLPIPSGSFEGFIFDHDGALR